MLVALLAAYLLLLFVAGSPTARRWLAGEASTILSAELGTKVSIGDVEIGLLNRAVLSDVIIEDQHGDTLLTAGRIGAKISWRSLAREKLDIRSIQLLDAKLKLYKNNTTENPNFQFLIDKLSSKDKDSKMRPLRIGSVILRRVELAWNVRDKKETPGTINPNHISLKDISASIGLGHISSDSLQVRLRELSVKEKSGLKIENMSLKMETSGNVVRIRDLDLAMPNSAISQPYMTLRLTDGKATAALPFALDADIRDWHLCANDFSFLLPSLKGNERKLTLSATVAIPGESVNIRNLYLRESSGGLLVSGDANILLKAGGTPDIRLKLTEATLRQSFLKDLLAMTGQKDVPKQAYAIGDISYSGTMTYGTPGLETDGKLSTGAGKAEGRMRWNGGSAEADMKLTNLKLHLITERTDLPTNISLAVRGKASNLKNAIPDIDGMVDIRSFLWNGQTFEGIKANGSVRNGRLEAHLQSTDPKINASADVAGNMANMTDIHVNADVRNISGLNFLPQQFRNAAMAGRIRLDLPRWPGKTLEGDLELSDASITKWQEDYGLTHLRLTAKPGNGNDGVLTLRSDFADIDLEGALQPQLIAEAAKEIGLRAIGLDDYRGDADKWEGKEWHVDAKILRTDELKRFLGVPIDIQAPFTLLGNIRADGGRIALTSSVEELSIGSFTLKDARIYINGIGDSISVLAQAAKEMVNQNIRIAAGINAKDGDISANVRWAGNGTELLHGALQTKSRLHDIAGNKILVSKFMPSEIVIGDTIWRVASDDISYGNNTLDISRFSLSHSDQSVNVSGRLSPNPTDSIKAHLQKVNIAYILNLVAFDDVSFDGEASGNVSVDRTAGYPKVSGRLDVPNFLFNNAPMGRLDFIGGFDTKENRLDINGYMDAGEGDYTDVKGFVSLQDKKLDLDIKSRNTNLSFLQSFVTGIFSDFHGKATGRCHLYGPFKELDFEGEEKAEASATIDAIGVNYKLSGGYVKIRPGEFAFSDFSVSDGIAGTGRASGALRHTHLKKINFDFDMETNKLLIYDKPKELDMPFYATAYGSGTMHLSGKPGEFDADVNMRPERGTVFTYTVDAPETFGDVKMVSYRDKSFKLTQDVEGTGNKTLTANEGTTDIRLNMLFDVNPDAMLKIIMNEKTGDNITVRGEGPIRANFYNKGPFRMYGVFNINEGNYRMNIQDVIRKDFQLGSGGTIAFNGDPYQGDLNMQAIYTVKSASLSDLNIGSGFSQNSVKVNCLLNFSGKVNNPQVSFDLDLPTVNEEEKQLVRNIISTEEDMNMQILYLLGIGRFYTYATPQDGTSMAGSQSAAAMKSFLSSTLSGQLNEIISNAVGSSNWSFGTNVSTGGAATNEFEVEGQLSGRLFSGRLLFNGNIGYRDKSIYNNSSFIGDFDVQYLLTPKGSVRLKAYSETNDRYFTKSSLTTQGIGVQLSRDFTNLRDLFNVRRNKKKKKQNAEKK